MKTRITFFNATVIAASITLLLLSTVMVVTIRTSAHRSQNQGLIWFTTDRDDPSPAGMCAACEEIYVTSPDGSDPERLTDTDANNSAPAWSLEAKRIAFQTNRNGHPQIFLMRADGTDQTLLADLGVNELGQQLGAVFPSWSPDGQMLCFSSQRQPRDIFVIRADGSGLTNITNDPSDDFRCDWSPLGDKIAFTSTRDSIGGVRNEEVYTINSDGTDPIRLTNTLRADANPDWSPDGEQIAFESNRDLNAEVYVMNADGSDPVRLTNFIGQDTKPSWSPNGDKIAFHRRLSDGHLEVFSMNNDGTNAIAITNTISPGFSGFPNWGSRSQGN